MEQFQVQLDRAGRSICAVCGVPRATEEHHLTHGVRLRLCVVHRASEYLRRKGGAVFVGRLTELWLAHGILTGKRRAALAAHQRRVRDVRLGQRFPGSYSWRELREVAERRFAAGEDPTIVIHDLRESNTWGPAAVPSYRTMRRWFVEARWLPLDRVTDRNIRAGRSIFHEPVWPVLVFQPGKGFDRAMFGQRRLPTESDMHAQQRLTRERQQRQKRRRL